MAAMLMSAIIFLAGDRARFAVFDFYQRMGGGTSETPSTAIVLVDDTSVKQLGNWPWPRNEVARLVDAIAAAKPKAIVLDILFLSPDPRDPKNLAQSLTSLSVAARTELENLPSADAELAAAIASAPVVLAAGGSSNDAAVATASILESPFADELPKGVPSYPVGLFSISPLHDVAVGTGVINAEPDEDGVIRVLPTAVRIGTTELPSLALESARVASRAEQIGVNSDGEILTSVTVGGRTIPLENGSLRPDFGLTYTPKVISAAQVLGAMSLERDLAGKIVIVGIAAPGSSDIVTTPTNPSELGSVLQARAIDSLLAGRVLRRPIWALYVEWMIAALVATAAGWLGWRARATLSLSILAVAVVAIAGSSWAAYLSVGLLFDPLPPLGLLAAVAATAAAIRWVETAGARAHIHQAFDRFLSPDLVKQIASDPKSLELGGEERDMTVLFCDVRSFSTISEGLSPQQVIKFLIGLLTPFTDVLIQHKATIDKYIGDAIVAFWNAPLEDLEHPRNAANAALAMRRELSRLNAEMPKQFKYPWPGHIRIGVGLNVGPVCVGNMGSERRLSYTIIGDTVNLASRIEGITKLYGVDIAIGDALGKRLADYALLELDRVRVVGRSRPERVLALAGDPVTAASPAFKTLSATLAGALAAYRSKDWDRAEQSFAKLSGLDHGELDLRKLVELYSARIAQFKISPLPVDWDGVTNLSEK